MTMTRLLTATALVALLAGPVAAQVSPNTPSSGQPADAEGETPATDDTTTQPATTTPPTASGDRTMGQSGQSGAMTTGTMQTQGSTNAGGTMGTTASGNMNAGGAQGMQASGNMNAGGAMAGGMMTSMNGNVRVVSNAPIPDTAENRARYGQPESNAGRSRIGEGPTAELRGSARARTRRAR